MPSPSSPDSSTYSLLLSCPSGLSRSQIWDKRKQDNSSLYNGLKFRHAGYSLKQLDGPSQAPSVCLHLGLTDYRTFVGTNLNPLWMNFLVTSEDDNVRCQHTSNPLGNGAIVETADKKILLLQRSANVGEFPGYFVFPGGHSEPREIGILSHLPENARSDLEDLNGKVCKEMFDGIIREVVEEIGVLPTSLSVPIFIGISQRLENVRPTAFFFLRCDMQSNEIHDVYCHAQDGFESTKLYSVSKEEIGPFTRRMPGCHQGGLRLYELME